MKTRTIIITFKIEDSDFAEYQLEQTQKALGCKTFSKLTDNKELYDTDPNFRELVKVEKQARKLKDDYINNWKLSKK